MAAPIKPWERISTMQHSFFPSGVNSSAPGTFFPQNQFVNDGGRGFNGVNNVPANVRIAPPVPPRPTTNTRFNSYNYSPYSSPYSNMYSPFGGYGYNRFMGYGNNGYYGAGADGVSNFAQLAEENSRPAFQSIESVVHAVSSISMMIESTYQAVLGSFHAVVGVADNFSRMKMQMTQIFSVLALLGTLRRFAEKLLSLLGLSSRSVASSENAWETAQQETATFAYSENDLKQKNSNWLALMFMALVFGTPWLIWKIMASLMQSSSEASSKWATGAVDHFVAVAEYDFRSESDREIAFQAGQDIRLAPKELQPRVQGWLLGSVDGVKTGLVPANYIRILGKKKGVESPDEQMLTEVKNIESGLSQ